MNNFLSECLEKMWRSSSTSTLQQTSVNSILVRHSSNPLFPFTSFASFQVVWFPIIYNRLILILWKDHGFYSGSVDKQTEKTNLTERVQH